MEREITCLIKRGETMNRSTSLVLIIIVLAVLSKNSDGFTPLEFLQQLQRQQQFQQGLQAQQEAPTAQEASANGQVAQQGPSIHQPTPPAEQPKEVFKPFHGTKSLIIKGCFTFADESYDDKIPQFRICFEGKETMSDKDGFFSIPVDEDRLEKYKLVITKTFQPDFDQHNTIKDLRLFADKNYKCYSFKKMGPFGGMWVQREKDLRKKNFIIPNNAIIILVDPKYIDHLDQWSINLASNFIKLPKIVLKKEVKHKSTDRAAAKSLLTALDAAVFHEEVREEIKQPSTKVKMALTQ